MTANEGIAALIAARCPGWVVESIVPLGAGDSCDAYLVNGEWVVRVAKHAEAAAGLRREACLLPRIETRFDLRIPIPRLIGDDESPTLVAHPLLPGPALTTGRYARLPRPARDRCAQQVADFLRQMHATDLTLVRQCGVPDTDHRARFGGLLTRARQQPTGVLAAPLRAFAESAITRYLNSAASADYAPVALHGDLSNDHILYDESTGRVTGIIDFGDLAVGDPAWDFVYLFEEHGVDFVNRCVRAYVTSGRPALLERMYRLFVLDTIEWALECAEEQSDEFDDALARLRQRQLAGDRPLHELVALCDVVER